MSEKNQKPELTDEQKMISACLSQDPYVQHVAMRWTNRDLPGQDIGREFCEKGYGYFTAIMANHLHGKYQVAKNGAGGPIVNRAVTLAFDVAEQAKTDFLMAELIQDVMTSGGPEVSRTIT
ncbi:MAG TPA: hypothetical protein VG604_00550 [Candidatus Saccharimonadales bacterium]|nr:hypothetical protein [Candidatus Saccharimonadales bacterium]